MKNVIWTLCCQWRWRLKVKLLHRYSLAILKRCILVAMKNRNLNDKELQLAGVISLQSMVGLSSGPQEDKWDTVRYLNPEIDVHNAQRSSSSSPSCFRNLRTFIIMRFVSERRQNTIFFLKGLLFLCGASITFFFLL